MFDHRLSVAILFLFLFTVPAHAFMDVSLKTKEFKVNPGEQKTISFTVGNKTNSEQRYRIFPKPFRDGQESPLDGYENRQAADWLQISTPSSSADEVTVQPGERKAIQLKVTVPDTPSLSGSYFAQIHVRQQAESITSVFERQERELEQGGTVGVRNVFQFVFPVHILIESDPGQPELKLKDIRFKQQSRTRNGQTQYRKQAEIVAENHGTRRSNISGRLIFQPLSDDARRRTATFDQADVWPGWKRTQRIKLPDDLTQGAKYRLLVLVRGDGGTVVKQTTYTHTFDRKEKEGTDDRKKKNGTEAGSEEATE